MSKFKSLFISVVIGLLVAAIAIAFNNPIGNPPVGTGAIIGVGSGALANSIYVNSSSNVGIGTTGPSGKLHVKGASGDTNVYIDGAGSSDGGLLFFASNGIATARIRSGTVVSKDLFLSGDGSNDHLTIIDTGNVGIGTAGPTNRLQVNGDVIRFERQNTGLDTLDFQMMSDTLPRIISNQHLGFIIGTGKTYRFDIGAGNEVMRIDPTGNVGIGTMTPGSYRLDVVGGKFRAAANVYDSGWFAVTTGTSYTKTHNLNTTKVLVQIYFSNAPDGNGFVTILGDDNINYNIGAYGTSMTALSGALITVRTGASGIFNGIDANGANYYPSSGYIKIVILALE